MSEERLQLMEEFRHDMSGIDPTTTTVDENPHPSFKRDPLTFKFEHSSYLFKVWNAGRCSAQPELAALREELAVSDEALKNIANHRDELQQRLTAAEQRNAAITELLRQAATYGGLTPLWHDKVQRFIKPTESGASE